MDVDKTYKRLKDIREDKDLKQSELAERLNIKPEMYSKWEREVDILPLRRANEFCNVMETSMDYLTGLSNEKIKSNEVLELSKKEVGHRLREIRKEIKMTQEELATFLNTSQSVISGYENGKALILSAFAYQIAREYRISLDWLIGRSPIKYLDEKM